MNEECLSLVDANLRTRTHQYLSSKFQVSREAIVGPKSIFCADRVTIHG
jgi:hypothetical protein